VIIFYAIDTVGLGHLSRTLGIAQAINELEPNYPIGFITEVTDARLLEEYPFAFYQVPNRDSLFNSNRWTNYLQKSVLKAWVNILKSILQAYNPKLLVFDTYIWPELQELARNSGIKQMLIMRNQKNLGTFLKEKQELLYDMELIAFPHTKSEIGSFELSYLPESKIYYSGTLLRRSVSDLDISLTRKSFGIDEDKFIVTITNGGGNALKSKSDDFDSIILDTLKEIEYKLPSFKIVFIKGPLANKRVPYIKFSNGDLFIWEYESKLLELYSLSNLVISRGGYNTVSELMEIGVPSLCIPAKRELDDQKQRIMNASHISNNIRYVNLDPQQIKNQIIQVANQPPWKYSRRNQRDLIADNKRDLAIRILSLVNNSH
jgi:UDP-N-acetylglucosamine--N-acetylmuramyl-(pentapeptide) pyrophosphoryl-undecaprenol N-acetylglucosamine transferase